jgi:REP element-mobilizing transposase RayT
MGFGGRDGGAPQPRDTMCIFIKGYPMSNFLQRRSIRLKDYDYTQSGAYFVTICTHERELLFGEIVDGVMHLNESGRIATEEWQRTPLLRSYIELDAFVVMPNHIHGILVIVNERADKNLPQDTFDTRASQRDSPTPRLWASQWEYLTPRLRASQRDAPTPRLQAGSLGATVNQYKAAVTKRMIRLQNSESASVWQRNYYEHVIRNTDDLDRIRQYIESNVAKWRDDSLYVGYH